MKNFQKLALGLMVGVIAIGFSAFKNVKAESQNGKLNNYVFVNTNLDNPRSQNAIDYQYLPDAGCESSSTSTCKANWSQTSGPTTPGEHPSGSYVSVAQDGIYNP